MENKERLDHTFEEITPERVDEIVGQFKDGITFLNDTVKNMELFMELVSSHLKNKDSVTITCDYNDPKVESDGSNSSIIGDISWLQNLSTVIWKMSYLQMKFSEAYGVVDKAMLELVTHVKDTGTEENDN